ncbi:LysR family transcriptional regulator [Pseudomonas sp. ACM7]|uniref:LysR family transcriptional regulator n=1 Tax=Pseudomonas sp. ACM7 TaxID=2052956 RepID=UPI002115ABC9|nr:LysR family transcriptional regulator [Pseudomonas sp. ACM7]
MPSCYKHYETLFHNGADMNHDPFDGLTEFLAVAEHKSFTLAATRLAVTPTAVSHAIKLLERRTGVLLFQRTTRRAALTEAGASLFSRLRPAASEINESLAVLSGFRDQPMGTLRLTAPRLSGALLMEPLIPLFRSAYPQVTLDISLDDATVDLMAGGFDAGIRKRSPGPPLNRRLQTTAPTKPLPSRCCARRRIKVVSRKPRCTSDTHQNQSLLRRR